VETLNLSLQPPNLLEKKHEPPFPLQTLSQRSALHNHSISCIKSKLLGLACGVCFCVIFILLCKVEKNAVVIKWFNYQFEVHPFFSKSSSFFQCNSSWRFFFIEKLSKYAAKLVIFLAQASVTLIKTAGLEHICFKSWLNFQLFKNFCLCGEYAPFVRPNKA
jgi:hypothetical protein